MSQDSRAGAYMFAGEENGIDIITHPQGYDGFGGTIDIGVCLDSDAPDTATAAKMIIPVRNAVNTWNRQQVTIGNLLLGGANSLASDEFDIESVILHETGHCIGLDHVNLASESQLPGTQRNATKSTDGANNAFDVSSGTDGIFGSADDSRGDDENLHWFNIDNNPFVLLPGAIDSSTMIRDLANLPPGDNYAVNGDRGVAGLFGFPNTEAVMQQGTVNNEAQRTLTADGVATIRLAQSGVDETEGSGDDYVIKLIYQGAFPDPTTQPDCDVNIAMDDVAPLAFCSIRGAFIQSNHVRITSAYISINSGFDWFFNQVSNDETDSDNDGIPDNQDNCINEPNGPLIPDAGGNSQLDTDGDGCGNVCDSDINNNGFTDAQDFATVKLCFDIFSSDPNCDLNGNGTTDSEDFATTKFFFNGFLPPGPSGTSESCTLP